MRDRIRVRIAATLLAGAVLSGCGAELLAGGQREGEVSAVATDGSGAPSSARTDGSGLSPSLARQGTALAGSLDLAVAVTLIAEDGEEEPITNGEVTARLRLAAADTVPLGRQEVPEGSYTRVRLAFSRVEAEVTEGLLIGGIPLLGRVAVEIGDGPLVMEVPVRVVVREEVPSTLVVDLRAAAWLGATDPLTRRIAAAEFRSAVEVTAR